jgi:hypothetical protein
MFSSPPLFGTLAHNHWCKLALFFNFAEIDGICYGSDGQDGILLRNQE